MTNTFDSCDVEKGTAAHVYDVSLPLDDPLRSRIASHLQSLARSPATKQIRDLDQTLLQTTQKLADAQAKRDFLAAFALDPHTFIRKWLDSQARDLDLLLGDHMAGVPAEDRRRAQFWRYTDWLDEGITVCAFDLRLILDTDWSTSTGTVNGSRE